MIKITFPLKDARCAKCGTAFENSQTILGSPDYEDEFYCSKCEEIDFIDTVTKDIEYSDYTMYLTHDGVAYLSIDADNLPLLENGIYEMEHFHNDSLDTFLIQRKKREDESVEDFYHAVKKKNFALEKNDNYVYFFFPEEMVEDLFDFYAKRADYERITDHFKQWTYCDSITYLCDDEYKMVGVSSGFTTGFGGRINREVFERKIKGMTLHEIEKVYFGRDMSAYIRAILFKLTPAVMLEQCQERIQGQGLELKKAVYLVYDYLQSMASGIEFQADNWILTSPSGTGKTEFYRTIKSIMKQYHIGIPVVQIDLSQITEAGYKGKNVNTIPEIILAEHIDLGGYGICFLDEADKKFVPSFDSHGVNGNAAVQSNLLTLLEGTQLKVSVDGVERKFDSSKTMFVLLGSFQELRDKKQKKCMAKGRIGFGDGYGDKNEQTVLEDAMYERITLNDMIRFGMQEELAGRITYVVNFHKLSDEDMRKLIIKKVSELQIKLGVEIFIRDEAVEDFLAISFGNLGVRAPMNQMKTLVQEAVARVFFDGGFDKARQRIVIDSTDRAHVEDISKRGECVWTK